MKLKLKNIKNFINKKKFIVDKKIGIKNLKTKKTFERRFEIFKTNNLKNLNKRYLEFWNKNFDIKHIINLYKNSSSIIDCGCGAGNLSNSVLGLIPNNKIKLFIANDINLENLKKINSNFIKYKFEKKFFCCEFKKLPISDNQVDLLISVGSLHHDSQPYRSLDKLVKIIKKNGHIVLWVYKKQPPIRELTDNFFRNKINKDKKFLKNIFLKDITNLAYDLKKNSKSKIIINKNLLTLGIKKGSYDFQSFIFMYLLRNTYNSILGKKFSYYENLDWFEPENNFTFEPNEIIEYFKGKKYKIVYSKLTISGISLVVKKT